ncbi:helix-turn-helix domain-containing protein [Streptomyces canus]|uniref:helix-turn-helix domain-containing protein n=1 Tax=Streptomyces canus TaxID=58343 RepID=UPI00216AD667|nr:helix-turn-helix domain-containing protein [Streptomyces canus]
MEAAERFRQGDENPVIAHDLRVSVRSVQRWRRAWSQIGPRALAVPRPARRASSRSTRSPAP